MYLTLKGDAMTINGGSTWATSSGFNKVGSTQSQSSDSPVASTDDFTSMIQQAVDALVSTIDTNKDGSVDKTEFSQAAQTLTQKTGNTYDPNSAFTAIDKNGDQSISADELLNALKQSQGKHRHHHKTDIADAAQQPLQTAEKDDSSSLKMQTALLQRIMSAYTNGSNASASTTFATV